jgi:hypothetical protein
VSLMGNQAKLPTMIGEDPIIVMRQSN